MCRSGLHGTVVGYDWRNVSSGVNGTGDLMAKRFFQWLRKLLSRSERMEIWYLERGLAALRRDHQRERTEARSSGKDLLEIDSRYSSLNDLTYEELESARTESLLRRARELRVPLPSSRPHGYDSEKEDENWTLGRTMGQWTLTDEGENRLRLAIRAEEKARLEVVTLRFVVATGLFGVLTGLVGAFSGVIATQQKELSRLDHLPRIVCDELVVENTGALVKRLRVQRIVFFDVLPCVEPCGTPAPLVRYVVDDYYRDLREGDYEGTQRVTFGLAQRPGNSAFTDKVSGLLQNALPAHGMRWQRIEVARAVRVYYTDWVGTKVDSCYWSESSAVSSFGFKRLSRKDWNHLVAVADSVRRKGRKLMSSTRTPDADAQRVIQECISAARR
jgi:hypothetical protein